MSRDLEGCTIMVAGASSGMGKAIAIRTASEGVKLILLARDPGRLEETVAAARAARDGAEIIAVLGDASNARSLGEAGAPHGETINALDVLINSVGMNIVERDFDGLTEESWAAMLDTNLTAAFNLMKMVIPGMRERRQGLVINIASTAARKADLSGGAYQAAKAGVVALNHAVMEEEWKNGIRLTAILPGMTDTPLLDRRPTPVWPEARAAALQPTDIAEACMFVMRLPPRAHVAEILLQPSQR